MDSLETKWLDTHTRICTHTQTRKHARTHTHTRTHTHKHIPRLAMDVATDTRTERACKLILPLLFWYCTDFLEVLYDKGSGVCVCVGGGGVSGGGHTPPHKRPNDRT